MALAETTTVETEGDLEVALKALASDIEWLGHVEVMFITRAASSAMR